LQSFASQSSFAAVANTEAKLNAINTLPKVSMVFTVASGLLALFFGYREL
jgi:hypothetical protein